MNWTSIVETYLTQRRRLGYSLTTEGRSLLDFARFAEQTHVSQLTISVALQWANLAPSGSPIAIARRFALLRPFSRYLCTMGLADNILPTKLLGPTHRRLPPFIFSEPDIMHLMEAANSLIPKGGLRPATMHTLIGLLAATGLRPGEAVRLQCTAVDLDAGELIIEHSKGWQRRIVPLAPSTAMALRDYEVKRDRHAPTVRPGSFFLLDRSRPLDIRAADYAFTLLRNKLGLNHYINGRHPRLYDLRHTFVCQRLLAWYQAGKDVNQLLPQLSRYLGHKKISDTYWYITAIPELLACASGNLLASSVVTEVVNEQQS